MNHLITSLSFALVSPINLNSQFQATHATYIFLSIPFRNPIHFSICLLIFVTSTPFPLVSSFHFPKLGQNHQDNRTSQYEPRSQRPNGDSKKNRKGGSKFRSSDISAVNSSYTKAKNSISNQSLQTDEVLPLLNQIEETETTTNLYQLFKAFSTAFKADAPILFKQSIIKGSDFFKIKEGLVAVTTLISLKELEFPTEKEILPRLWALFKQEMSLFSERAKSSSDGGAQMLQLINMNMDFLKGLFQKFNAVLFPFGFLLVFSSKEKSRNGTQKLSRLKRLQTKGDLFL